MFAAYTLRWVSSVRFSIVVLLSLVGPKLKSPANSATGALSLMGVSCIGSLPVNELSMDLYAGLNTGDSRQDFRENCGK